MSEENDNFSYIMALERRIDELEKDLNSRFVEIENAIDGN